VINRHNWNFILCENCCSNRWSEAMFLVRINNKLHIVHV